MSIKNVTVAGGGVLGSQIALQSAYCGFNVKIWLRTEASIGRCTPKLDRFASIYAGTLQATKADPAQRARGLSDEGATPEELDALAAKVAPARAGIVLTTDWDEAFGDADLVIEAVAEEPGQKIAFYEELQKHLPEKTIVVTNSSTLLPSQFAAYTGRPEKYLALHFANNIFASNTAEVMGHAGTEQAYYDQVVEFAEAIRMVPLCLKKEQPGYILNSMLVPFLSAAEALYATDVCHGRPERPVPHPRRRGPGDRLQHRVDEPGSRRPEQRPGQDRREAQGEDRRGQDRHQRWRGLLQVQLASGVTGY